MEILSVVDVCSVFVFVLFKINLSSIDGHKMAHIVPTNFQLFVFIN
jgi:hypothetical protein